MDDLLIIGLGAFGWLRFWKLSLESWNVEVSDGLLHVLLISGTAATIVLLGADVAYCRWIALGLAGFAISTLALELFRLLQALTDVQRVRVLLSSRKGA